ncbi:MAG: hypothetical protein PUB87_00230 [Eubacteriaceae bacterium]|nr:hypothetical protein [Eubacteriaceae bacterium]
MKKLIPLTTLIAALLLVVSCAASTPAPDETDDKSDLTVKLEISEDIKEEDVTVDVALTLEGSSFIRNISLSRSESSKTEPVAVVEYKVMVKESNLFDFIYPDTIRIDKEKENTLLIKVVPKGSIKDDPSTGNPGTEEPDPVIPPKTTGTLDIDFCNFFGAKLHYEIYNYYNDASPIEMGDTEKDIQIELPPGEYKISANLVYPDQGIKLFGLNDDLGYVGTEYPIRFTIEKGKKTFQGYYIKEDDINKKETSRYVVNATIGKELLGNTNAYGHDVSISYVIEYENIAIQSIKGFTYEDKAIGLDNKNIRTKCSLAIEAKSNGKDVSDQYVIKCAGLYSNYEQLDGETDTNHAAIFRGKPIKFTTDLVLTEDQKIVFDVKQYDDLGVVEDEEGRFRLAYDIPYSLTIRVYQKDPVKEGSWNPIDMYYEETGLTISEGCDSVIHIERN